MIIPVQCAVLYVCTSLSINYKNHSYLYNVLEHCNTTFTRISKNLTFSSANISLVVFGTLYENTSF
jgi:hypothetical protein